MSVKSAAVLIISDENLQKPTDNNYVIKYIINELNNLQYDVKKLSIISENVSLIIVELETISKQFDVVITISNLKNGAIYKAMGKLFSQRLESRDELLGILNGIQAGSNLNEVTIPVSSKLLTFQNTYPVVCLQRIFALNLPTFQETFENALKLHLRQLRKTVVFKGTIRVIVNGNATDGTDRIAQMARDFNSEVEIDWWEHCLNINIASENWRNLLEFCRAVKKDFKVEHFQSKGDWEGVHFDNDTKIRNTLENIEKCLMEYDPKNIFLSFNGGKDCTVLLHLLLAILRNLYPNHKQKLFCLYVQSENSFPEQDEFINQCKEYHNLEIVTIRSNIKEALKQVVEKNPNFKACLMGTRRTDPFSANLNIFQVTDPDWPQIMRVSPLLEWHYCDIWDFLLYYKVPYCKLYDLGFTSLGNVVNTIKNPSLVYFDVVEEREVYLPAFKLLKEGKERNGRNK